MHVAIDVSRFLNATLKRVSLPSSVSIRRQSLVSRLDELQQAYPQLCWESDNDDNDASRMDQTAGQIVSNPASSMNESLTVELQAYNPWQVKVMS